MSKVRGVLAVDVAIDPPGAHVEAWRSKLFGKSVR
jgi:hypothetical protein